MFIGRFAEVSETPNPLGSLFLAGFLMHLLEKAIRICSLRPKDCQPVVLESYTANGSLLETMELRVQ
jgi:hypothetical protein